MKVIRHIALLIRAVLYYLATVLSIKDRRLWVFGAWKGLTYNDNSKYLFEFVLKNCPEIKAYWITKSESVFEKLKSENKPVALFPSKEAKRIVRKSKYHFLTEGPKDVGQYPVGGATVIMLWHGVGPKMANWWKKYNRFQKALIHIESGNRRKYYWTFSSPYCAHAMTTWMDVDKRKLFNGGFPRCDALKNGGKNDYVQSLIKKYDKSIIYMPTHRNWGKDFDPAFLSEGLLFLDKWLAANNYFCLFKIHPNELQLVTELELDLKNIHVVKESEVEFCDPYEYVFDFDCLISDYSSIIYDYLCVNKPIVLFPYDLKRFSEEDGGLSEVYFEHQVGPIAYDWESLVAEIGGILKKDDWFERRSKQMEFLNKENDGASCQKIVSFVKGLK